MINHLRLLLPVLLLTLSILSFAGCSQSSPRVNATQRLNQLDPAEKQAAQDKRGDK